MIFLIGVMTGFAAREIVKWFDRVEERDDDFLP